MFKMKKIVFLLLISLFAFGCGDKNSKNPAQKNPQGELSTSVDNAPPKEIALNYSLQKNQHLSYKVTSVSNSTQSIIADTTMSQNMKQTVTYLLDMDIKDVDAEKIMEIQINLKSVAISAEANGQKVSYQSGKLKSPAEKKRFAQYEAFVNNPFVLRINPKGEIQEISRVDRIVNKFLEIQGIKDSVSQMQRKQMQTSIAEGELRPLIQQVFRSLPGKNVGKDSLWNFSSPARLGVFEVENIAKFRLNGFEKLGEERLAVIDAGLDIVPKGKTKYTERGINYNFKKPEATGNGRIYFNVSKGCIQRSKTSTTLRMSLMMQMPKSPRGPMKATRNDVMETTNIVELL